MALERQQAQIELANIRSKGSLQRRLALSPLFPKRIKQLLPGPKRGKDYHQNRAYEREHAIGVRESFLALKPKSLTRVQRVLFPKMQGTVERAWEGMAQRPYQTGERRKPFRCPHHDGAQAELRGAWLLRLGKELGNYEQDARWLAQWTGHLVSWHDKVDYAWLLAGALDPSTPESAEVLQTLKDIASGEDERVDFDTWVIGALLASNNPEAWQFVEQLLLAAKRQEGVRQAILERVDEAHPGAFRRMLRLILDENLARFSATVRAFDCWFGFHWDGASGMEVNRVLESVLELLDDEDARAAALASEEAEQAYLALWCYAFEDVESALPHARAMLADANVEKRFVATHLLVQSGWDDAEPDLVRMLADPDLRVAGRALWGLQGGSAQQVDNDVLFAALEELLERMPKRTLKLDPIVWPWWSLKLERPAIAQAMWASPPSAPAEVLLPYVKDLDSWERASYVRELAGLPPRWGPESGKKHKRAPLQGHVYEAILELLGDTSPDVREGAFEALDTGPPAEREVARLVELLGRKANDLRNRCLKRLAQLDDVGFLGVARTLVNERALPRRVAGLELLREAVESERGVEEARALASEYAEQRTKIGEEERSQLEPLLAEQQSGAETAADENLAGVDASELVPWPDPRKLAVEEETAATAACIEDLARLIAEHRDSEAESARGEKGPLLEVSRRFRLFGGWNEDDDYWDQKPPLPEVWRTWARDLPATMHDADGLHLVRAFVSAEGGRAWQGEHTKSLRGHHGFHPTWKFLLALLGWCVREDPPTGLADWVVDGLENALSKVDPSFLDHCLEYARTAGLDSQPERRATPFEMKLASRWDRRAQSLQRLLPGSFTGEHHARLYALRTWLQRRTGGYPLMQVDLQGYQQALLAGALGEHARAELAHLLLGEPVLNKLRNAQQLAVLQHASTQRPPKELSEHPELLDVVDERRRHVVSIELRRGDRETIASKPTLQLRYTGGIEAVVPALAALGSAGFARTYSYWNAENSRKETLSHIVVRSAPREEDSLDAFAEAARAAKLKEARLVELAAYAPQWAAHVNHVLEWEGLEDAVWWLHAHTKDERWTLRDMREIWAAQVSERTPLSADELTEGAVDVAWFGRVHATLGAERWAKLAKAAKYASSSGGHKRAQLYASAMLSETTLDELYQRIDAKRHQDAVRALGLVPLATKTEREADLLQRFRRLQEFQRESRKFGSQRQASEKRAVQIGLENLARTAGFQDPLRLQWAMERQAVADLAEGPVVIEKDEVALTLSIDESGAPELEVRKKGRVQKSVPVKLRKDEDVLALRERMKELRRQASRVKGALEEAMVRGDVFSGSELRELMAHPILAPSLSRLVFVGEDLIGYPIEGGQALSDHAGHIEPVRQQEELRLAHAHDLYTRGDWHAWQSECFQRERIQPFKQVFRELYLPTEDELGDSLGSRRYAGHQVQPRQALALFTTRGWVAHPEEGVARTDHALGLTARLTFQEHWYTPADVEGLTLAALSFTHKGKWTPLPLSDIPPRLYSESLRDLDLVVSVAHQGGVDPETSSSTIEMRAQLLRESCRLLQLDNVEVRDRSALIQGERATYTVHLGSAQARLQNCVALVIVAVHSQHRGRLFLPFADDDPRTAEVLSKVLLLARDKQIQDPSILAQIRGQG